MAMRRSLPTNQCRDRAAMRVADDAIDAPAAPATDSHPEGDHDRAGEAASHAEFRAFLRANETFASKSLIQAQTRVTLLKHPAKLPKRHSRGRPNRLPAPVSRP
jgi:hypothetical protein